MIGRNKIVFVGKDEELKTIKEALIHFPKGKLTIELTSDIQDRNDIEVPKTLRELTIRSKDNQPRLFLEKNIKIYLNNTKTTLEYVGVSGVPTGHVIGSTQKNADTYITINHCCLRSVIGAYDCKNIDHINLYINHSLVVYICGVHEEKVKARIVYINMQFKESEGSCIQLFNRPKELESTVSDIYIDINHCLFEHVSTPCASKQKEHGKFDMKIRNGTELTRGINVKDYDINSYLVHLGGDI